MLKYINIKYMLGVQCVLIIAIVNFGGINCQNGDGTGNSDGTEDSPGGEMTSGVQYTVDVTRIEQVIAPSQPFIYMYYQSGFDTPITYYQTITADAPLMVNEALITVEDVVFYSLSPNDKAINLCENSPAGSMEENIRKILDQAIMNGQSCPIPSGTNFLAPYVMPALTLTFDEKIQCGHYSLVLNLDGYNGEWAAQFTFGWDVIEEQHDCYSVE